MDPSWPRNKCASSWPPLELPAPMEMDRGHWGLPHYMRAAKSADLALPQNPSVLNSFNFGSSRSYRPESKYSESLCSGLEQLSSSKPIAADTGGTQELHFATKFQSNSSLVNGQEISFNLNPTGQVANLTRNSDRGCSFYETANDYTPCDNVGRGLSNVSQEGPLFSNMNHISDGWALSEVIADPKFKMMQRMGRVFCLRTRGDLLLNNMGCLIVVCVCHNMHLSVAKFCEHSGLPAANPGEAVCMETGENIALWRKIYFSKIGIRLPDDNSGWDLYDSSSLSHLGNRSSSASPCMLNKSTAVQTTHLLDGLPKSVKFWGAVNLANNPSVERISSTQMSDAFQIKNSLCGPNIFQTIPGNSNGIQSTPGIIKHSLNDGQQYRGYENVANCMNLFTKESSLFNFDLTSSNVKLSGSDSSVPGISSEKGYLFGSNVIASNVELTLGQPSHSFASAKQSCFQPFNQSCNPQKSSLVFNQTSSFSVFDSIVHLDSLKTSSNILSAPSGMSVSHKGEKEIPLSHMRGDLTYGNIMETATSDLMSNVDTAKRSIAPVYLQQDPSLGGSAIGHGVTHYGLSNNRYESACAIPSNDVHNGRVAHAHLLTEGTDRSLKSLRKLHLSNNLEMGHGLSSNGQSVSYVSPMPDFLFHTKQIGGVLHTPANTCDHVKQTVSRPQGINANLSCDLTELMGCSRNSTEPRLLPPSITTMCSFSKKLQSTSNKNEFTVGRQLLDESVGALSSKNAIESSKQDKSVHLLSVHPCQTNLCDKPHPGTCMGSTDFIEKQLQSSCQINTTVYPDPAWQQLPVCCNHYLSSNSQNFTNIGVCCHCPTSVLQFSSGSRHISGGTAKQSLLSSFQIRDNNVPGNIERRRHDEVQLNNRVSCLCCHDGHPNCLPHIHSCIPNQRVVLEGHDKIVDGKAFTIDNELHSDQSENLLNLHFHSKNNSPFQWKDIPRKDVTHEKRAEALGAKHSHKSHTSKIGIELKEPGANIELLKEKPLSDCPVSSAPPIMEISVDKDSSALRDGCGEWMIENLVDEMSETGRCGSYDENECTNALKTGHSFVMSKPSTHEIDLVKNTFGSGDHIALLKGDTKQRKKIRSTKWKKIDSSVHLVDHDSCNNAGCFDVSPKRDLRRLKESYESSHEALNLKQVLSGPLSATTIFKKRKFYEDNRGNCGNKPDFHEEMISSPVTKKKLTQNHMNWSLSLDRRSIPCDENQNEVGPCREKLRPVVCGRLGIISNEKHFQGHAKPLKIVSLSSILKVAKRCVIVEHDSKGELCSTVYMNPLSLGKNHVPSAKLPLSEKEKVTKICSISKCPSKGQMTSRTGRNDIYYKNLDLPCERQRNEARCYGGQKVKESSRFCKTSVKKLNSQFKKIRKHALSQLIVEVAQPKHSEVRSLEKDFESLQSNNPKSNAICLLRRTDCHSEHLADSINATEFSIVEVAHEPVLKSHASCCVCGSLGEVEINRLLQCSSCFIRVHQACYGVHKVPKGHWCCRPCRANSKDMACVLCGYGGGAMTRAMRSNNTVKSLLNAWAVSDVFNTWEENLGEFTATPVGEVSSVGKACKLGAKISIFCSKNARLETNKKTKRRALTCHFNVENTITAGVLDSTVKQWVHMVCGLWTPGTRCPNVHTMSAFDVSGASPCAKDVVCSICNRPGGSCIKCRDLNCSVMFHAWCAHQKGLLQSEIEGIDDEKIGFYGSCLCHATNSSSHSCSYSGIKDVSLEISNDRPTCARAEGYKGRKAGDLTRYDIIAASSKNVGLVPEEQINAWVHINGQKSCTRGKMIKPLISDTEFDCRKEYARYKQAKGWKKLVVYKSGIHALGLYTSQFISRGGIVVEYVGEVVGLRVADKREREYQSGRKLLYESACYFFRVDKEHIVDATRKGGIARFVNHSCLPNCVARIISVRNEKKVIFIADRDINPGEEITYDYHFNHEDEGKKIPCYCRSKNCRQYLN